MSSVWLESGELTDRRAAVSKSTCDDNSQSVRANKLALSVSFHLLVLHAPMVMCRGRLTILSDSANLSRLGMLFSSVVVAVTAVLSKIADVYIYSDCAVRYPLRYGTRKLLKPCMTNDLPSNRYLTTGVLPKTVRTRLYLAHAALYRTERSANFLVIYARASTGTEFAYMLFHHHRSNYPKTKPRQNQFLHGIISSISSDRITALLAAKPTNLDVVEANFPIQLSIVLRRRLWRRCCRLHLPL